MPQVLTKDDAHTAADVAADAQAAQAAAQAGFVSVDEPEETQAKVEKKSKEPVAEKTEAEKAAEAKAAKEAAAKAAAEAEWDGVPVRVRKTLEAIEGKVGLLDRIEPRLKSVEGRTGAALEGVHALKTALEAAKAATKAGGEAPTQEQIAAAATSSAKWKQAKEDYPDWAEAMDERLAALPRAEASPVDVAGLKTELTGTVSEIVAQAASQAKAEARELARIDRKHENWEETVATPDFKTWRDAQPPEIQALGASDKSADAIKMLDAYEAHRKAVAEATAKKQRDQKRLDSAITPKGVAQPATRNPTDEEAKLQGFLSVDT